MKKIIISIIILCLFSTLALSIEPGQLTSGKAVRVSLLSQQPVQVQPGNYVEVRVNVENVGAEKLEDFKIEAIPKYPFSLKKGESSLKKYGTIRAGFNEEDSVIAKWKLRVDKDAVEGDNELKLRYKYKNSEWIYPEEPEISIETLDSIINIKEVKKNPEKINPGEKFNLTLKVQNVADSFVENLKLGLDTKDSFVSLSSTNEKFIRILDGKEVKNVTFNLISKGDMDTSINRLPLKMTYYDNKGKIRTKNVSLGLVVEHTPKLVKNIEDTEVYTAGDKGSVSVSLSNVGVGKVRFLKLKLLPSKNYKVISPSEIYIGNIDSDDYESGSFEIKSSSMDSDNLSLNYEMIYKDQLNREHNEKFSLDMPIYSKEEAKELGFLKEGNPIVSYIGFVVVVFLFAFWSLMVFDLAKKKQPRYKKLIWLIILLLTTIFGAILYYIIGRR